MIFVEGHFGNIELLGIEIRNDTQLFAVLNDAIEYLLKGNPKRNDEYNIAHLLAFLELKRVSVSTDLRKLVPLPPAFRCQTQRKVVLPAVVLEGELELMIYTVQLQWMRLHF